MASTPLKTINFSSRPRMQTSPCPSNVVPPEVEISLKRPPNQAPIASRRNWVLLQSRDLLQENLQISTIILGKRRFTSKNIKKTPMNIRCYQRTLEVIKESFIFKWVTIFYWLVIDWLSIIDLSGMWKTHNFSAHWRPFRLRSHICRPHHLLCAHGHRLREELVWWTTF